MTRGSGAVVAGQTDRKERRKKELRVIKLELKEYKAGAAGQRDRKKE